MSRILLAILTLICWQASARGDGELEELKLANLEAETQATVALTEQVGLLCGNWNLRGVETAMKTWHENAGFVHSTPPTDSFNLETKIATGAWATRITSNTSGTYRMRYRAGSGIPSTLPPFDVTWMRSAVWPLTRSYMEHVIESDPIIAQNDRIEFNY